MEKIMATTEIKDDDNDGQVLLSQQDQGAGDYVNEVDKLNMVLNSTETKVAEHAKQKTKAAKKVVEIGDDDEDAPDAVSVSARNHDDQLSGKKVSVTFYDQDAEDGDKPIFASLNGFAYQIPRGTPVNIPVELLEIFENARTEALSTDQAGGIKTRTINRFQYSTHGAAR